MQNIQRKDVDEAIEIIKKKFDTYSVSPKLLSKFSDSEEDQRAKSYIGAPEENYTKFLPLLIEHFNIKNIVELGNREGRSTLCMYDKLAPDAQFITIDIEKDQRYCPEVMYNDPRVSFIYGDVCDLSIYNSKVPTDIDLLFTDTIHFDFQLRDEFAVYENLLSDTALIAIDDIHVNDKGKLFEEINHPKWDLSKICHPNGWGLILFKRKVPISKEERVLKAYQASAKIWKRKFDELHAEKDIMLKKKITYKVKSYITERPALHKFILFVRRKVLFQNI